MSARTGIDAGGGAPRGLSRALYDELRARIADGTFRPGAALPSTRALAAERGLSRTTVSAVYDQLAADGFIDRRAGAASRVAAGAAPLAVPRGAGRVGRTASSRSKSASTAPPLLMPKLHAGELSLIGARIDALGFAEPEPVPSEDIDFVYGPLAGRDFPVLAWMKALRHVERQRPERLAYEDPRGNLELRRALQSHLSQTRGLSCALDQLLIVNGSQQALDLCARLLVDPGDAVVVENPGYRAAHHVFETYGAELIGVGVDGQGVRADALARIADARLLYVTPTHQFPLGGFLPIGRRRALLDWASRTGAWIVEDDYDSEYRYAVRPEATLCSLDTTGCVIHVGTLSKTLSPQLRLGYLVLPPRLAAMFATAKRLTDRHSATGIQRALAKLLADGTYDRHVRRMRRLQQARQAALVDALTRHLGDRVRIEGAASGLHLVVWLKGIEVAREAAVVRAARVKGVRVYPISGFYLPEAEPSEPVRPARDAGLVMGYALLDAMRIDEGVRRLAGALRSLRRGASADAHDAGDAGSLSV